uniref:Uncharacterized protein n=1 Tax=Setaria italica TaxID=4555 RepID=K4ANN2_SETIT
MLWEESTVFGFMIVLVFILVCCNRKPSCGHYPRWSQDSTCYIFKLHDMVLDASGSTELTC